MGNFPLGWKFLLFMELRDLFTLRNSLSKASASSDYAFIHEFVVLAAFYCTEYGQLGLITICQFFSPNIEIINILTRFLREIYTSQNFRILLFSLEEMFRIL